MLTHDLKTLPDYARKVEAMGYDCLWSSETQHDPYLPLAIAATVTTRIKLGTKIATVFPRSPMITAHIAWDLQTASGGRFMLGLGTQVKAHNERRFSVKWESPGPRGGGDPGDPRDLGLLAERHPTQLQGGVLQLQPHDAVLQPGPDRAPEDPDLHRGREPATCAAWQASSATACTCTRSTAPSSCARSCSRRSRRGSRSGRARKDFTFATASFVIVGDTPKERTEAAQSVKQQIAFYGSTRTYKPVLDAHGWGDTPAQLTTSRVEGDWDGMADLITDEMLDAYAVTATYDKLHAKIMERYQRPAGPHGALPALPAQCGRPARTGEGIRRIA